MKQYIHILTCLLWLGLIGATSAQTRTITGNVTDDQGVPLTGATILEQGTANGVTTDFDGNFSLEVADGASGSFTHTIEGASTMSFLFSGGDWDSEVTYNIVYSALDGSNTQTVFSDGPSPSDGEKILSICQ